MGVPRELRNPAPKGLRLWPVKDFDEFLIFYVVAGDTLKVYASCTASAILTGF
jgi:hypothetical protein